MQYTRLLTVAGSDSGGGAGIQADLKTFAALGCYGMSAITALTAQNTQGVAGIYAVPPDFVGQQIDAVLTDIGVDAVKIGMLATAEIIQVVAARMHAHHVHKLVLDPVMVATSGDALLRNDAVQSLCTELLPLTYLVTPNVPEAAILLGRTIETAAQMDAAARDLLAFGCQAALVKGGHFSGATSVDVLAMQTPSGIEWVHLSGPRIDTPNTHGTGCTFSAASAAYLGQGLDIATAVRRAKTYMQGAIEAGAAYTMGHGHGPVHHLHAIWPKQP